MADYVISLYQAARPPEEFCDTDNPQGDWYWNLDDGHLPVGPYPTERAAREAALQSISEYHEVMVVIGSVA
jgi:hypothetical protein